jgi:hypothetical protein
VAAELGTLALKIAYERWTGTASGNNFGEVARGALSEVQSVAGPAQPLLNDRG